MIDTRAVSKELQDLQHQIAGRIRKSQESVAGAIKTWTHAAQAVRPQIPSMPKAETLTARLPKAETLVTGAYDLAGQFVAGQRKLAGQMVHSARPLARQGAAMLGYGAALPGHGTARSGRPDETAKAQPAKAAPAKARTAKAQTAKAAPARAAAAQKSTGAGKARSAKK